MGQPTVSQVDKLTSAHSPLGTSSCDPLESVDLDHGCESETDDDVGEEGEVGVVRGREGWG